VSDSNGLVADPRSRRGELTALDAEIERLKEMLALGTNGRLRRCRATNRAGTRCGKPPMLGQRVCAIHGGKASHSLAAARRRLLEAAEPVVVELLDMFHDADRVDTRDRIRIGFGVLDRAGLAPSNADRNDHPSTVAVSGHNVMLYIPDNGRSAALTVDTDTDDTEEPETEP
jgi:hypothetical protein